MRCLVAASPNPGTGGAMPRQAKAKAMAAPEYYARFPEDCGVRKLVGRMQSSHEKRNTSRSVRQTGIAAWSRERRDSRLKARWAHRQECRVPSYSVRFGAHRAPLQFIRPNISAPSAQRTECPSAILKML